MDYFVNIVRRMGGVGVVVAASFLIGIMVLTVANVIYRLFGPVILGSYELTKLMMVVTAGFALVYAAMWHTHVVVKIVTSRFSQRVQAIAESFASLLGIGMWGLIALSSVGFYFERGLWDRTDVLHIPFQTFRYVWIFALILFALVLLTDFYKALSRTASK